MATDLVTHLRDIALGCMPTRELAMKTNYWLAADMIERLSKEGAQLEREIQIIDADAAGERAEKESLRYKVRWLTSESAQLRQDLAQQTANTRTVLELQAEVERLTSELAQAKGIISVLAQWPGIAAVRKETIGTLTQERDEAIRVLAIALACDGYDERHAEWMAEAIRIVGPRKGDVHTALEPRTEVERLRNAIAGYVHARLAGRGSLAGYWFDLQAIAKESPINTCTPHPDDTTDCRFCGEAVAVHTRST